MPIISIILSDVHTGRRSNRVSQYFKNYLTDNKLANTEILDLNECNFPIFIERLKNQKNPSALTLEFVIKINSSEGIIMVTPEYNDGQPAG